MQRLPDWQDRLSAFVAEHRAPPFVWGERDCCLFAADWVEACTGVDPAAALRGRYTDQDGARAAVRSHGGYEAMISSCLGCAPLEYPLSARRGDVAAVDGDGVFPALGIVLGSRILVLTPDGLRREPITEALLAWQVG
jgi:hypothetical protein